MAVNNGTDGIWFSRNSSTSWAVREFTVSKSHTSTQSGLPLIRFTHSTYTPWTGITWWCRFHCGRTDGTPGYASGGWWKGHILWVGSGSYLENRYNDTYGRSDIGFNYWPSFNTFVTNVCEFSSHYYGAPGWSNIVTYNLFVQYHRWDLLTVTFP